MRPALRSPGLTAAMFLGLAAAPASAEISGDLQHLPGAAQQAADVARHMADRLADAPPVNRPPQSFTAAMNSIAASPVPELPAAGHLAVESPADALALWSAEYAFSPDCHPALMPAPDSLDQAATQVAEVAVVVRALQRAALEERDWRRLEKDFSKVSDYLEGPQPAPLSWWEKRRLRRFLERTAAAELDAIYCAAHTWLGFTRPQWLEAVARLMRTHPRAGAEVILRRETPLGSIVFGGADDTTYREGSLLAIFDLAGDDIYALDPAPNFDGHPRLLVDMGGDDRYESPRPGAIAGAVGRISLLWDTAGDDRYRGHSFSQGSALLGVAMLIDSGGNDEYRARHLGQGAALAGLGLLLDRAGSDDYELLSLGQGMGLFAGVGMLSDRAGDDDYRALAGRPTGYGDPGLSDAWSQGVGVGLRGIASGGLGVLVDADGADRYDAGVFSQGGGYYRAAGRLLDLGGGSDEFTGTRYAMGWGAHGGLGFFENTRGDDRYRTRHSVVAGLAWDYSVGVFRDRSGDDDYRVGDFSLGASAHGSVAVFLDEGGSDRYRGTRPARRNEGPPNLSVFLDRGEGENLLDGIPARRRCRVSADHGFELFAGEGSLPTCPPP